MNEETKNKIKALIEAIDMNIESLWNSDLKQANAAVKLQYIAEEIEELEKLIN